MVKLNPKVSIIIPVYNGANFLAEAIDSALAQTYSNIEVVVVNDGSKDNGKTEKVALSYGDDIEYYIKENGGVASALNFGIQKMTGEYFSWLSHDDLYERTKIEEEVRYLLNQPAPDNTIIACNSVALFENGIKKKEKINHVVFNDYFDIFLGASAKTGLNGCSLLIPKNVLIESGGFNINLPVTQDYDLWFRLKDKCKFTLLDRHLVVYRHHDMQDSVHKSDTSLIAGDELRAHILRSVSKKYFANFIRASKKNEKWIWESYSTYKSRGYIKTSLEILRLSADLSPKGSIKALGEVTLWEGIYRNHGYATDTSNQSVVKRIEGLEEFSNNKIYLDYVSMKRMSQIGSYIESIKNDGLGLFIHKAGRKLIRILRKLV